MAIYTIDDYDQLLATSGDVGNPTPVEAIALVFRDGVACVYVRVSNGWKQIMAAPANSSDGLACGVDCRRPLQGIE